MNYIPAIDGMRAVAILIVLSSHFISEKIPGGFGVTLFFFISGYLITRLLIEEHAKTGTIAILPFYVRRFRRLAPALIAMVLSVVALYWILGWNSSATETFAALFYFVNYYSIFGGDMPLPFGPLWSLAVEEHYYLLYPGLLFFGLRNKRSLLIFLIAICVVVLFWRIALVLNGAIAIRTYYATDTRIDSIIFGAILALVLNLYGPRFHLLGIALCAAVILILAGFLLRSEVFRETARYTFQGLALMPIFYAILTRPLSWHWAVLEHPVALWIGKISYSLYLWHFPILEVTRRTGIEHPVIIALPLSFAAATFSYYFVETPFRHRRAG